MSDVNLDGFDPLEESAIVGADKKILQDATKRHVLNILKSYTGYWDVFSEAIQNSLDAIDGKTAENPDYQGIININIDIKNRRIRVFDNGVGMDPETLRLCFRPEISFKRRSEMRGHKGVGATFLGYGFNSITIFTKTSAMQKAVAVQLANGRTWAEDVSGLVPRPKLHSVSAPCAELDNGTCGTVVDILVGVGHRPDLTYQLATNADQWMKMLRIKTPLGGVYLVGRKFPKVTIDLTVVDLAGTETKVSTPRAEYFYPHEELSAVLPKVKEVRDVAARTSKIGGDKTKLPQEYKDLSALYDIWTSNDLLSGQDWDGRFSDEQKELINRHQVAVYACFVSTSSVWGKYQQDVLGIRKSPLLLKGGMQIASDYMPQGDLQVIPLTSTIGYQANTHCVIHFKDGNPDMGRKVFQPEIKSLAESIAVHVVNIFKGWLHLVRPDSGASPVNQTTSAWEWQQDAIDHQKANPISLETKLGPLGIASVPRSEQDCIALFHELIGSGIIRGYQILATSEIAQYDCVFRTFYSDSGLHQFNKDQNSLGVDAQFVSPKISKPYILEYKFNMDALIGDFSKAIKSPADVDLLVCWDLGEAAGQSYRIHSLLVGSEGATRQFFGATHAVYQAQERRFEVVCLSDVISFLMDRSGTLARHASKFSD